MRGAALASDRRQDQGRGRRSHPLGHGRQETEAVSSKRAKRSLMASRPSLSLPRLEPHHIDILGLAMIAVGIFSPGSRTWGGRAGRWATARSERSGSCSPKPQNPKTPFIKYKGKWRKFRN